MSGRRANGGINASRGAGARDAAGLTRGAASWTRRRILAAGAGGLLGLGATPRTWLPTLGAAPARPRPKAQRVIFLFQWGGPSHIDMFDLKPDAPAEFRGPYQPIASSVPGLQVGELLPETAKRMHHVTLVRTLTHRMKNHNSAGYYALSGHAPPSDDQRLRDSPDLFPAYGSVVDALAPATNGLPTFVAYPHRIADGSITPGQHASFLGKAHDPLLFTEDPNAAGFRLPELTLPAGLTAERMARRRGIQGIIDAQSGLLEASAAARGFDDYYGRAVSLLTSPKVREAFDLEREPAEVRDRYGRTTYGQSCLLARRLVEAGVKFVTVYFSDSIGGKSTTSGGWDTHGFDNTRMFEIVDKYHFPVTERTLPTLLDELDERGLLDDTLVVWMGEFGRTPEINKSASRDHWPQCYSAILAGGGVRRGHVHGRSDARAMYPDEHPVTLEDLAATLYHLLGIDPATEVHDAADRPLPIAGRPVFDLLA